MLKDMLHLSSKGFGPDIYLFSADIPQEAGLSGSFQGLL